MRGVADTMADTMAVRIILLYKVINNLISMSSNELTPLTSLTRGHKCKFYHIYARNSPYYHSFAVTIWNTLP